MIEYRWPRLAKQRGAGTILFIPWYIYVHMQQPGTVYYLSSWAAEPPGTAVWVQDTGVITGKGKSRWQWRPDYVCLHLVAAGSGTVRSGVRTGHLQSGDMFCLWPEVEIEYAKDPEHPWQVYWLRLGGALAPAVGRACGFGPACLWRTPSHPATALAGAKAIFEEFRRRQGDAAPYRVASLLYQLVDACGVPPQQAAQGVAEGRVALVARARHLVETAPQTVKGVTELAESLHVSRTTLFLAFREVLGLSPIQFIADVRVARAKQLLRSSQLPLDAVARLCGFNGTKYFQRCFRHCVGLPPGQWRKARLSAGDSDSGEMENEAVEETPKPGTAHCPRPAE